jgi:thioesterase domain-containing protein
VRPIGICDNYFELGGHSIAAVRLMNRIEETFGKNLSIATLLQAPTIEQMAVILRQESAQAWSCLVPIQTAGSKRPFFCIHGANGTVVRFLALSQYLGSDQPFYCLQAQGLDSAHPCHTSIEQMAAHYLEKIRSVQPEGPYFLGGFSLGGSVALQIAQQLVAQGEPESTVVFFDTNFPGQQRVDPGIAKVASSAFLEFFRIPANKRCEYLLRMVSVPARIYEMLMHLRTLPPVMKKVRQASLQAEIDYTAQPYGGRVIMFRSDDKPLSHVGDPREGWEQVVTRGLETYEIKGTHDNILLEPQVRIVAEQLKACLNDECCDLQNGSATPSLEERTSR